MAPKKIEQILKREVKKIEKSYEVGVGVQKKGEGGKSAEHIYIRR